MGEVIRRSAPVADILADAREAQARAEAAGGSFKVLAEQTLKPALLLCALVEGKLRAAEAKATPLEAAQAAQNGLSDGLVARTSDLVWNDVGRPSTDAQYDLLFPGGITFYTDGPDEEQPARMELLAELLTSDVHPGLEAAQAKAYAKQLRESAAAFEAAVDAARKPRAQVAMYERMLSAAGRNAQVALASYKRLLKAHGVSEARIHEIIPDRPSQPKKPEPAPSPPSP